MSRRKSPQQNPEPLGGGWYLLDDGSKVQGRAAAYEAAGLDPDKNGNRRSDAAKQRRRGSVIDERRARVASLLVQRTPYRRIAKALGVSLSTIAEDVAAVRKTWRADAYADVADYVLDEITVLDNDEFDLRVLLRSAKDSDVKIRIYDRIQRIMVRRAELLGLDAPTVRRVLLPDGEATDDLTKTIFVAGGNEDDFVAALAAAQGQQIPRKLRAVK